MRGLILTHGHEDHIGAVPFLLAQSMCRFTATAFTLALVERRLEEHEMLGEAKLIIVKPGRNSNSAHSPSSSFTSRTPSCSCVALAITTPLGVIIHTGDFKVDPTPTDNELFDLHTLAEYGKRGVLLLMSDSTNVDRPGYTESERAVRPRLEDMFYRAERRLVISCFSSSIHRLQQILDLADEYGRKVAFLGRSMIDSPKSRIRFGLLQLPGRHSASPAGRDAAGRAKWRWWFRARRANRCRRCPASRWTITSTFRLSGRHRGAERAHHSRQRKGDLPDDQPLCASAAPT